MAKKLIRVTAEDIKSGRRSSPDSCPIASALYRMEFEEGPSVGYDECSFSRGGKRLKVPLPESAQVFIEHFDLGEPVKPFSFYLDLSKAKKVGKSYP